MDPESARPLLDPSPEDSFDIPRENLHSVKFRDPIQVPEPQSKRTSYQSSSASGDDDFSEAAAEVAHLLSPVSSAPSGQFYDVSVEQPQILRNRLYDVRIEWPQGGTRYFVPADDLKRLFTEESILAELDRCQGKLPIGDDRQELAKKIFETAVKLFAVLVHLKMGHYISGFLREDISDIDLPFERSDKSAKPGKYKLCSSRSLQQPIKCIARWDQDFVVNFEREQWCVLAPIFERSDEGQVPHYELGDNCVLPFIKDEERSDQVREGGFSTVWEIVIHPAHQKLYRSTDPKVGNSCTNDRRGGPGLNIAVLSVPLRVGH